MIIPATQAMGTYYIAGCFIFIAYILHPIVERAYHRVRAYRAWLAIEKGECIEVTHLNMVDEVLRGHGRWDAARIAATSMLLFSIASWVLELTMKLANITGGPVDLFDRPPPVLECQNTSKIWCAKNNASLDFAVEEGGSLDNFEGSLEKGRAKSRYRVEDDGGNKSAKHGETIMAFWYDKVSPCNDELDESEESGDGSPYCLQYSESGSEEATLENLSCRGDYEEGALHIEDGDETTPWGHFTNCAEGPSVVDNEDTPPPTIILSDESNTTTHLLVEEEGSYPGFVYSVWNVIDEDDASDDVTVGHVFHVASNFRLAEAIITGIANGVTTGGGCVDLMMQFSDKNPFYDDAGGEDRARPFGEHPRGNRVVDNLEDVEPVVRGVSLNTVALTSLVVLGAMSLVGIAWSLWLRSSIEMDIYDRDELIRAVSLHDYSTEGRPPASMRMFVRKDASGRIDVVVSDGGEDRSRCCALLTRSVVTVQDEPAVAISRVDGGANAIPTGPRQLRLQGMRLGLGRDGFPRGFGPRSSSITSSPVQSPFTPADPVSPAENVDGAVAQAATIAQGRMALRGSSRFGGFFGGSASPCPVHDATAFATPTGPGPRRVHLQGTPSPASVSCSFDHSTPPRTIPVGKLRVLPAPNAEDPCSCLCPNEAISGDSGV